MSKRYLRGAEFLVHASTPEEVTTPGDFTSEQRMFAKAAKDFMEREVFPVSDKIEGKEPGLMQSLIRKSGEMGFAGADIPEEYGGLGLDKTTSALIYENLAGQGSFLVVFGGQVGIGSLPIVYYGTHETKLKYLPSIADGTKIGCFALTESMAGSDAMACRSKALLADDGSHYILTGTKQFITNAEIADIFIVFAKVEGAGLTGFVLERAMEGLTVGPSEKKMGLHGTYTNSILLDDVKVPVENVLGEVGRGHKIAFNILNIGRFKIGSSSAGAAKHALEHTLTYCLERKQFGKRLVDFGAIREKLAEMLVKTYAVESMAYRTVGAIDRLLEQEKDSGGDAPLLSIEEYAIECATVKVVGSEVLDYIVDEALQCLGGYGYCEEYPMERFYRDSRVNRIFEGTNEINRQLIPAMALRRAGSGAIPLFEAMQQAGKHTELQPVERLKDICLFCLRLTVKQPGEKLPGDQPVISRLADLIMLVYGAESATLRALKDLSRKGRDNASLPLAISEIITEEALVQAESLARQIVTALASGDELDVALATLGRLTERKPVDTLALREVIAARLVELERIPQMD